MVVCSEFPAFAKSELSNEKVLSEVRSLFDTVMISDVRLLECRAESASVDYENLYIALSRRAKGYCSKEHDRLWADVHFRIACRTSQDDSKKPDVLIEAKYRASYAQSSKLTASQEALDFFAQTNATFNLWPYWREFVHSTAERMSISGLVVPSYRIEEAFSGPGTSKRAAQRKKRTK